MASFANVGAIRVRNITSIDEVKDPIPFTLYVDSKGNTYEYGKHGFSEIPPSRLRNMMISYLLHENNHYDEIIYKIWKTIAEIEEVREGIVLTTEN